MITPPDFSPPVEAVSRMSPPLPEGWAIQTAQVRNIRGQVFYWSTDQKWKALQVGWLLSEGALIQTDLNSHCDLFLKWNGPVIRITEGSFVAIERLRYGTNNITTDFQTVLNLKKGRILGVVKSPTSSSFYQVQTPNYLLKMEKELANTEYEAWASGRVIVFNGTVKVTSGEFIMQIQEGQEFDPVQRKVHPSQPKIISYLDGP